MAQITIADPLLYERKEVDSSGRVYLGKEWADTEIMVVVEAVNRETATE